MKCMMTFDLLLSFPAFNVTINISSSLPVEEGSDVILTCVHDLPNGSYSWMKDNELQEETSKTYEIKLNLKTAVVQCNVKSYCGVFNSNITVAVKGDYTAHYFMIVSIFFDTVTHLRSLTMKS